MLQVHSLETFSTHDGPGLRSVIFTQGCNFRCLYCHNPDTQALTNPQAKSMSTADVVNTIKKYLPYYSKNGGLTVSGGEPTLQAKDLLPIFQAVRKLGVTTCLDTNGSILSPDVEKLYLHTNLVIFDVKHIDPVWHQKLVGGDNATVLKNVQLREKQGLPFWLRLVLVPGYSDQPEFLQAWGETFANLKHLERVEILPYHTYAIEKYEQLGWPYPLPDVPAATDTDVAKARAILEPFFGKKIAG